MQAIQTIYDDNHQIYGAPKIAKEMQKKGEKISQRTVGVYMREMGIKACYIKPYVKQPLIVIFQQSCITF